MGKDSEGRGRGVGTASRLSAAWDEAARRNAMHYVATEKRGWLPSEFLYSAIPLVNETVAPFVKAHVDPSNKRCLDIGCGLGRTTVALSYLFGEAYGVDFSPEMIDRARLLTRHLHSLSGTIDPHFVVNDGLTLPMYADGFFDLCFSYTMFQHIPDFRIIESYIGEINRVLRGGGLFILQFNGARWGKVFKYVPVHRSLCNLALDSGLAHLYYHLTLKDHRGIPIFSGRYLSLEQLERVFAETSLVITDVKGKDTRYMWLYGKKA
jgi:SAM-dependent methyltransferase